jgi:hypothetical protein
MAAKAEVERQAAAFNEEDVRDYQFMKQISNYQKLCRISLEKHEAGIGHCERSLAQQVHQDERKLAPIAMDLRMKLQQRETFKHAVDRSIDEGKVKFRRQMTGGASVPEALRAAVYPCRNSLVREAFHLKTALPSYALRDEFLNALKENDVVIVKGATGSGKSTQLAQYAAETMEGLVVCSQPRKLAAAGQFVFFVFCDLDSQI